MDFEIESRSEGELTIRMERVTLRGSDYQPYNAAKINIVRMDPKYLAPPQRYCLISELRKIEQLRWNILANYPYDIFRLAGYIKVRYPEENINETLYDTRYYVDEPMEPIDMNKTIPETVIDILPPVVEEYIDERGKLHLLICDGQHRCFLAYQMGYPINVVYVRGATVPYYSYPLPNGWEDVELIEKIPEGYLKKFHIARDHKSLYRNFNSQFSNIGDSRPYEGAKLPGGISEKDMPPPLTYADGSPNKGIKPPPYDKILEGPV
jgi:hypothetical protein